MRVIVSTDKCIASGTCVLTCPQVFTQQESDGVVHVFNAHPSLELMKKVRAVVDNCPAQVFTIEDEENTSELTLVEDDQEV
jgi:ferredoxin